MSTADRFDPEGSIGTLARIALLALTGFVGLTAVAGGISLILGALVEEFATILTPPVAYLEDSPFGSFLVPGVILAVVVGGTHLAAFGALRRRTPHRYVVATVAAFGVLVWIFVQMVFIPFSFLQAAYFVAGIAELGLVLFLVGVLRAQVEALPRSPARRTIGA